DSQLSVSQELARSSKVEPKKNPYSVEEGDDSNDLDPYDLDDTDSEIEMGSNISGYLEESSDPYGPDEINSEIEMNSSKSSYLDNSSVLSDKDQMKSLQKEKSNQSPSKVWLRKYKYLMSMTQKLGLGHSMSSSITSKTANGHVMEKACSTSDDLCEKHPVKASEGTQVPEDSDIPQNKISQTVETSCSTCDDTNEEVDNNEGDFNIDNSDEEDNKDDFHPVQVEGAPFGSPRTEWEE
ncbi:hypothetical protein STEG23_009619, partial [Scotinomys teguina]